MFNMAVFQIRTGLVHVFSCAQLCEEDIEFMRRIFSAFLVMSLICSATIIPTFAAKTESSSSLKTTTQRAKSSNESIAAESFPKFSVPGQQQRLDRLRELFLLHHQLAMRPKSHATFALAWIPKSTIWASAKPSPGASSEHIYWQQLLEGRRLDEKGYVSCHQHRGLGHSEGWPFPLWTQVGGKGWHFSLSGFGYGRNNQFGIVQTTSVDNWSLLKVESQGIDPERGWNLTLTEAAASIETPVFRVRSEVAPIIRLEWETSGLDATAKPYLEWITESETEYSPARRISISPRTESGFGYGDILVHTVPTWKGIITRLRLNFGNASGATVTLREIITAMDTRHNVNNMLYLQACDDTLRWTGDIDFLRKMIKSMRKALAYMIDEFETRKHLCVFTSWAGHDGRSGIIYGTDGKKTLHPGRGVGGNYFDLMPFGAKDALATVYLYDAMNRMASLENCIEAHSAWDIPPASAGLTGKELAQHAAEIKQDAGQLFWNQETGRFVGSIDVENKAHDYGFTFLNLEAIYYDFATPEQAKSIMDWVTGKRIVEGDTSQSEDIYRWRFGPRATTRRNIDYYQSIWSAPESIPWGYQIQDGGAVLGFTYFDLMSRLKLIGPDNTWQRLKDIIQWYEEVQQEGGYRKYYGQQGKEDRGSLQGCGTPGGIGVDCEFMESVLAPQIMLYGFMGIEPKLDGLVIKPRLPKKWPELTISQIHFHKHVLDITASDARILIHSTGNNLGKLDILPRAGQWQIRYLDAAGKVVGEPTIISIDDERATVSLDFRDAQVVELLAVQKDVSSEK